MKSFYLAIKGVIKHNDKVLLIKRTKDDADGNFWEFPGGRINDSESFSETLQRELREEVGIVDLEILKLLHMYQLPVDVENSHGLFFLYFKVNTSSHEIVLSKEHSEYRWVTKDESIDLPMNDGTKQALSIAFREEVIPNK